MLGHKFSFRFFFHFSLQKLRLFSSDAGAIFPMDSHLETHVKDESLFSGSNVILEYVDNSCTHLVDFEKYKPG